MDRGEIALKIQASNRHLSIEQARYYVDAVCDEICEKKELRFLNRKELDSLGAHADGMDGDQWDSWVQQKFAEVNGFRVVGGTYDW